MLKITVHHGMNKRVITELKNEYISLRIKAANDETLFSAKVYDALHYRGSSTTV